MSEVTLTSPFPEISLPSAWSWVQHYVDKTPFYGIALGEFVEAERQRLERVVSWGVHFDGSLIGLLEFDPQGDKVGFMDLFFRREFFGRETAIPALQSAASSVFKGGAELILFRPFRANKKMRNLLISFGASDVGILPANGIPERSVLGLTAGDFAARGPNVQQYG